MARTFRLNRRQLRQIISEVIAAAEEEPRGACPGCGEYYYDSGCEHGPGCNVCPTCYGRGCEECDDRGTLGEGLLVTRSMLRGLIREAMATAVGGDFTVEDAGAACEAYAKRFGYEYRPVGNPRAAAGIVDDHAWLINIDDGGKYSMHPGRVGMTAHTETYNPKNGVPDWDGHSVEVTPDDLYDCIEKGVDIVKNHMTGKPQRTFTDDEMEDDVVDASDVGNIAKLTSRQRAQPPELFKTPRRTSSKPN